MSSLFKKLNQPWAVSQGLGLFFLMVIICIKIFVVVEFGRVKVCYNVHSYSVYPGWNKSSSQNNLALSKDGEMGEIFFLFKPQGLGSLPLGKCLPPSYSYTLTHMIYLKGYFPHKNFLTNNSCTNLLLINA